MDGIKEAEIHKMEMEQDVILSHNMDEDITDTMKLQKNPKVQHKEIQCSWVTDIISLISMF